MKTYFLITIISLAMFSCASKKTLVKPAVTATKVTDLPTAIDQILQDSSLTQTRTGIKIVSLKTGETLYSRNSQLLFHPASNMKLLTTSTALKRLGADFKFPTRVFVDSGSVSDSTITGPIYLKGYGDPDLVSDDLRRMVDQLKLKGIRRISGDLICDNSYMDDLFWGNGWMWDDASDWYWAQISPLTVNDNCVEITVKPGAHPGDSLRYQLTPNTAFMKIVNHGVTVDSSDSLIRHAFKVKRRWKHPANIIDIEGGRFPTDAERDYIIDVIDAPRYVGTLLGEMLRAEGIVFDGVVRTGETPKNVGLLVEHLSPPLSLVIFNTNKISDNLSAELLLKTVGAEMRGIPGTAKKGISEIYKFLQEIGVDSSTYELADGSGVSRYNVITPDLIIELLKAMNADFRLQAEFKASLPVAGVDGSLDSRMKNTPAENKLRAKTGTLRGVSALSGYTTTADGEPVAFSMIMEHFVVGASKIRRIQDKIGAAISLFTRREN